MKDFAMAHPFLTFFLALIAMECALKLTGRIIRHLNIRKCGWPPAHLDADGDWATGDDGDDA